MGIRSRRSALCSSRAQAPRLQGKSGHFWDGLLEEVRGAAVSSEAQSAAVDSEAQSAAVSSEARGAAVDSEALGATVDSESEGAWARPPPYAPQGDEP